MRRTPRANYRHGDHVCTLFRSPDEQINAAVAFIRAGLARGEQCMYSCCDQTLDEFREELRTAGVDVEAEEARGALQIVSRAHVKGGAFDAARTIEWLSTALSNALNDGFTGLCGAGDMTWLLDGAPGSHELLAYEALINYFCANRPVVLLCQYNRETLPPKVLDSCLATHPHICRNGSRLHENPFFESSDAALIRFHDGTGIDDKLAQIDSLG
jgi:chemotaxis family two-component system sensor kinase Cph1